MLQMHEGWQGLLMDGGYSNPSINLQKEFIMAENIEELFRKHSVPEVKHYKLHFVWTL